MLSAKRFLTILLVLSVVYLLVYSLKRIIWLIAMTIAFVIGISFTIGNEDEEHWKRKMLGRTRNRAGNKQKQTRVRYYQVITGNESLDLPLNQIVNHIIDEYFYKNWKTLISGELVEDKTTPEIRESIIYVLRNVYDLTSRKDWVAYFTGQFIDILAAHIRLYRQARETVSAGETQSLTTAFFAHEEERLSEMGSICGFRNICERSETESAYFRDVIDILLYLLMRPSDFDCVGLRLLVREIVLKFAMRPLTDLVCAPNFLNQNIIKLFGSPSASENASLDDSFIWAVRKGNCSENELNALLNLIFRQLDELNSGDPDSKPRAECLHNIRRCVESSLRKSQGKSRQSTLISRSQSLQQSIIDIPLEYVLENNLGLDYLMTFMQSVSCQHYVLCYMNLKALKSSMNKSKSVDETQIRLAYNELQKNYCAELKQPIQFDQNSLDLSLEQIEKSVKTQMDQIINLLRSQTFYGSFKRTNLYGRLLEELDILSVQDETRQFAKQLSTKMSRVELIDGVVYYSIEIVRSNARWMIDRRYNDFCDFNHLIKRKYSSLSEKLNFPGFRRFSNNNTTAFILKRQAFLGKYLQELCADECLKSFPGLEKDLLHFLRPGVDAVVPLPESQPKRFRASLISIWDRFPFLIKRLGRTPTDKPDTASSADLSIFNSKVNNSTTTQKRLTPIRALLILTDELFDLGKRSISLRNQLTTLIKQLIHKFAGASYSRNIEQMIEKRLYGDGLSGFFFSIRDAIRSEPTNSSSKPRPNPHLCSILAKTRLVSLASAELRAVVGSNTSRNGFLMIHELLQSPILNRRLFHVVLDDLLKYLFPPNDALSVLSKAYGREM